MEFFVQDTHHKRIIGVGGKNIQGIMKEYGVYVKFLSNDEFKMIGGLNEFDQNVIARTPAKNSENLKNLHRSVLGVVDGDTEMEGKKIVWLELPRRQHGRLRNYCRSVLESELSGTVKFIFPLSSAASERVRLEGDAETIDAAVKRLRTYIVQSVALYAPLMTSSQQLQTVQESKQFKAIQQQIKSPPLNLQLSIAPQVDDYSVIKISGDWESVERYSAKISGDLQKLLASCGVNIPDQSRLPFANNTVQIAIINGQDQHPDGTNSSTDLTTEELGRMSNKLRTSRLSGSAPNLTLNTANLLYADGSTPQQQQQRQQQQSASGRKTPLPIGSFKQLNISVGGDGNTSNSDDHEGSINNGSLKSAVDQITTGGRQTPFLIRNDEQTVHQQRSLKSPAGILDPISTHTRRFTDGIPLSGSRSELASPFGQIKGAASFIGNGPTPPPITAAPVGRTNTGNTSKAEDYASDNEDYDRRNIVSAIGSVMNSVQAADSNWRENNRLNLLLDQLDLAKYKQTFSSNDVDFEMFLTLTEQDFKELGVSLGARRRMNLAIGEIRQQRQSTQQPMQPAILRIQTNGGALPLAYTSLTSAPALVAAQSPTGQTKQQMWGKSGGRNNAPVSAYPDLQQQRFYPNNQPLSAFAAPSNPYALVSPINVTGNKQFFVQQPYPQQQPQQVDGKDPNGVYHTVVAESQKSPPNIS